MVENGPRTKELVEDIHDLRELLRVRGNELEGRVTEVETQLRIIRYVGTTVVTVIAGVLTLLIVHGLL